MLMPDANVLLHAVNVRAGEHAVARRWLQEALAGGQGQVIGLAWATLLAFWRLSTHPAVFPRPLSTSEASHELEAWLASPQSVVVQPSGRHLSLLSGLLARLGTAGNLVSDAHLAALALEHDATVVSFDRDFGRFEGVRWHLPE